MRIYIFTNIHITTHIVYVSVCWFMFVCFYLSCSLCALPSHCAMWIGSSRPLSLGRSGYQKWMGRLFRNKPPRKTSSNDCFLFCFFFIFSCTFRTSSCKFPQMVIYFNLKVIIVLWHLFFFFFFKAFWSQIDIFNSRNCICKYF